MATDIDFYKKYTTEPNQVLLEKYQSQIDAGTLSADDITAFGGCMYETFGLELDYVRKQPNNRVWTVVDTDGDDLIILAGFHFVNRLGYLVTNEEWLDEFEEYLVD